MKAPKDDLITLSDRARQAISSCLSTVSFAEVESVYAPAEVSPAISDGPDIMATVKTALGEQVLLIDVKSSGEPRFARQAVNELERVRGEPGFADAYPVFVAPYVSSASASVCAEAGVGFVDFAGNCGLDFANIHIERAGAKNPFAQRRELKSLFRPKASRVLRALMADPRRTWRLEALAAEAGVSLGHAHNVKRALETLEWASATREGTRLTEPRALLDEWARSYTLRQNEVHDYYSMRDPREIEVELGRACAARAVSWALTGFSGASHLAPAVRYDRAMAYVSDEVDTVAGELGLKEVDSGPNVTLLVPADPGVFYGARGIDGVRVASPIQLYLDLWSFKGRGREAADELMRQVIEPTW